MYTPGGALTAVFGEERNGEVTIGEDDGESDGDDDGDGDGDGEGDGDGVSSSGQFPLTLLIIIIIKLYTS